MVLRRRLRIGRISPYHDEIVRLRKTHGVKSIAKILKLRGVHVHWSTIDRYIRKYGSRVPSARALGIECLQRSICGEVSATQKASHISPADQSLPLETHPSAGKNGVSIHMVFGPKGGTGKSTFAVLLAEWLEKTGDRIHLIDMDEDSRTLSRERPEAVQWAFPEADDVVILAEDHLVENEHSNIIWDLPPGNSAFFLPWLEEVPAEELNSKGIKLIGWACVTANRDSRDGIRNWIRQFKNLRQHCLLVQNHKDGRPIPDDLPSSCNGSVDFPLIPRHLQNILNLRNIPLAATLRTPPQPTKSGYLNQLKSCQLQVLQHLENMRRCATWCRFDFGRSVEQSV